MRVSPVMISFLRIVYCILSLPPLLHALSLSVCVSLFFSPGTSITNGGRALSLYEGGEGDQDGEEAAGLAESLMEVMETQTVKMKGYVYHHFILPLHTLYTHLHPYAHLYIHVYTPYIHPTYLCEHPLNAL